VYSTEVIQRVVVPALQLELPMTVASNPDPSVGKECRKADLDTTVGEDVRCLDLKAIKKNPATQ
jgi:hypothetical protein